MPGTLNRVGVFVDCNNLYSTLGSEHKVDYSKYLEQAVGGGSLVRAFAYGAQIKTEAKPFIAYLKHIGFTPKYLPATIIDSVSDIERTHLNMIIAMDVIRLLNRMDTVVIGSNQLNLIPLCYYLQEQGLKVVVFASKIKDDLRLIVDDVIEISSNTLYLRDEVTP